MNLQTDNLVIDAPTSTVPLDAPANAPQALCPGMGFAEGHNTFVG